MPLDIQKLKKSGYTEKELVDELGEKLGANVDRARDAGISDSEILSALADRAGDNAVKPKRGVIGEFVEGMNPTQSPAHGKKPPLESFWKGK